MTRLNKLAFFLITASVIFTTLIYGTVHPQIIAFFYVVTSLLALLWAADSLVTKTLRISRHPLQGPIFLLGVYALVQIIPFGSFSDSSGVASIPLTISADPFATKLTALHIFALCIFFAAALVFIESASRLRRIATVLSIFGFTYAFYAILQSVLSPDAIYGIYKPQATPFGSFVNRNDFAAMILMLISVPLGLLFTGAVARDKKLLFVIAIVVMATALFLSGSRGGLVAMFAEVVFLVILTTRTKGKKNFVLKAALSLLLIVGAIAGAVFVGGETTLSRVSETAKEIDAPPETVSRFHMWGVTTKVIVDNLPFGAGLGAFPQVYSKFDTLGGYERVDQAHNDYLQILADAGIVGLILGGVFLFTFFRQGFESARVANTFRKGIAVGAFAGCFAVLVHSMFDFVLHITAVSVMFITQLATLVASGREYKDDIRDFDDEKPKRRRRSASVTELRRHNVAEARTN
jgi:O-antigen ligase